VSKHLGPSNLASKPLVSKNNKIKIKPGREGGLDGDILAATERVRDVDERSALLGGERR